MEPTLFSFIWKYSRREQLVLLAVTLITFPFLYMSLVLPKNIINDAIGAESDVVTVWGIEMGQVQFLMALCVAYLGTVLVHGLLKMRLNTMKGVLSERLLRRFRYTLIARMMRFPRSYYQNTSQGELVAMVTSEAEPMGGLMGDAVAQPVFQAGQMLVIVVFLFLESVWFGLAGIALIPLQAWLIPMLQRQINLLNKERIVEVRQLAAEIGETAAGITDLRNNGGWRFRLAGFTERLGRLFHIRFRIYQKKFFMKFLNNFITQLTPFFFYAVGGYLVIKGQVSVGALVAALAAYKDLSSPWKELLTYYNQVQDMSLRWEIVTERFGPKGMIDEALFEGAPDEIPHLKGDIAFNGVSLRNGDGNMVLDDISVRLPRAAQVAMAVPNQTERRAMADLLTREVIPTRGRIDIGEHNLAELHQAVIAARIGYAPAQPYLFQGTIADNLLMSLRTSPKTVLWDPKRRNKAEIEARRSGNSADSLNADWLDPDLASLNTAEDVYDWWYQLSQAMGTTDEIFRRMLNAPIDPDRHPDLARRIVGLRQEVHEKLVAAELDKPVYRFDPERFNPTVPLGANLMFSVPRRDITQTSLVHEHGFMSMVIERGLAEKGIAISQTLIETLHQTFGMDGTDHPLFTALGIEEALYEQLVDIATRRREKGDGALTQEEFALLLTVPFALSAEDIGPAFPESFKAEILEIRKTQGAAMRERVTDLFVPITPDTYLPRLTILENLLYGRITNFAGQQAALIEDIVSDILREHGLEQAVAVNLLDIRASIAGANLPRAVHERLAINRAGIKRPDVLVFDQSFAGRSADAQVQIRRRLARLLPDTTQIFLEESFANHADFDFYVEIKGGHVGGIEEFATDAGDETGAAGDLRRKLQVIARTELFENLDPRSQRLLAFAARWYPVEVGDTIFRQGDPADAAYLCLSGRCELCFTDPLGDTHHVTDVEPGRLIGDLAIILDEPRQLDLIVREPSTFLRIGAEQFRSVVEHDEKVLMSLLKTVAGHLTGAAEVLKAAQIELPREAGPPPAPMVDAKQAAEAEKAERAAQAQSDRPRANKDTSET